MSKDLCHSQDSVEPRDCVIVKEGTHFFFVQYTISQGRQQDKNMEPKKLDFDPKTKVLLENKGNLFIYLD